MKIIDCLAAVSSIILYSEYQCYETFSGKVLDRGTKSEDLPDHRKRSSSHDVWEWKNLFLRTDDDAPRHCRERLPTAIAVLRLMLSTRNLCIIK